MTLNISVPTTTQELRPKITVIGVGGAGGNAVNNMIAANLEGIEFLVTNTDGQALSQSLAERKIQLGRQQTQGLGAGSKPEVGRIAAEESLDDILAELTDSHMVFITAGMGGGTGTGAAPVIAKAARERGILTVGVVTKPFDFEGQVRMKQANAGIEELQAYVDTLIIIPNQNLFRLANERTTFADAFAMADEVLHKGVCGITDLMIKPGDINLDFADIRSVMSEMGKAMMGTGEASGENRAANAAEAAINNPLLDETSMSGAQAVLINITGGTDMTLFEVDEAANHIRREVDNDANIIIGSAIDERMDGIMRVSVVATGMEAGSMNQRPPQPMTQPTAQPVAQPTVKPMVQSLTQPVAQPVAHPVMEAPVMETAEEIAVETDDDHTAAFMDMPSDNVGMDTESHDDHDHSMDVGAADDDQTHLEDLVAAADASEEAPEDGQEPVMDADGQDDANEEAAMDDEPVATEDPFVMRAIVNIPEEPAKDEPPKSLIGHIAGLMFASKPAKADDSTESTAEDVAEAPHVAMPSSSDLTTHDAPRADHVEVMGVDMMGNALQLDATDIASEEMQAEAMQAEAGQETATIEPVSAEPKAEDAEMPMGGLASLKPTNQPKLDMNGVGEDVDLDIPAFLRRQAN